MNVFVLTAFVTGLFGSLHCAGMCGPLALSFNFQHKGSPVFNGLLYNAGRITAYIILGLIFGAIGLSFSYAGLQQFASIISGFIILLILFFQQLRQAQPNFKWLEKYNTFIKVKIGKALSIKGIKGVVALGFFNGFLPCGLVYLALAGAVAGGAIISGAFYMLFFGLGTLPMMLFFSAFGNYLGMGKRIFIRKYLPVFSAVIGVLLILRGLNLGIPFISPEFHYGVDAVASGEQINCHK